MTAQLLPAKSESLDGFLRRFAEAELRTDVSDLLRATGLDYGRALVEQSDVLEETLDLPSGSLDDLLPAAAASDPCLNWRFERFHSAPVCPVCIATGQPHQQAWRHCFVTACVEHSVSLVDECPMCGDCFQPGRGGYDSCHCGCPLDRLPQVEAKQAEVALSALIAGVMHPSRALLPPALAFRTPRDIGDFVFFLAAGGTETKTDKPGKTPLPRTVSEAQSFLAPALSLLCDWPNSFSRTVADRLVEDTASSAPARLGKWYQRLMRFDGPSYADFRSVLSNVVTREFDGIYTGCADANVAERRWISASAAAKEIGIRAERLVEAVASDKIPGRLYASGFGHRHTVLDRDTVQKISADRAAFWDKSKALDFLGISRKQYDLLLASGFLAPSLPAELPPLVDGLHDANALMSIVDAITEGGDHVEGETVAFGQLNLRFTTDMSGIHEVFRRIASGALCPLASSTEGKLSQFRFSRSEVDRVLTQARGGPGLTVQEVAKLTGWKEQCIAHWCTAGFIKHTTFSIAGRTGRVIQADALVQFQKEFVPVADLAKQMNTSSRSLITKLASAKIEPLGAVKDGRAWRGHLLKLSSLATASYIWSVQQDD